MNAKRHFAYWSLAWACSWIISVPCLAQTDSTPDAQEDRTPDEQDDPTPSAPGEAKSAFTDSDEHWYDLDAPTGIDYELDEIFAPHTAMFKSPLDAPINSLLDQQRQWEEDIGLRVGFAYTQLYQQASGGPGERWGMSGDADLMFDWTLVGRGTEDTGRFFFSVEERFRFASDITPGQLSGEIGSLVGTGGPFNDRGLVIRDAFWDQRLFDAKLRLLAGRAASDDYVGSHRLASANFAFFNASVAGNPTMAFPGHGPLALVSVHPSDLFYATVGGANAYNLTTESGFSSLDEGEIYGFGEIGVTPEIEGLGKGRYAVTGWNMPSRDLDGLPSDWGVNFTIEQYLADDLWVYARYGFADQGVLTGVESNWSVALAIDGLLGSPDNITGIGFGYAMPTDDSLRDQKSAEVFHRFQLTEHTQFSVGAQAIFDPSNAPDKDVVGVFSLRLRISL
ncbi:MAG: hypothetical protein WBD40_23995 [Tepidisphaeraceae bacterium]